MLIMEMSFRAFLLKSIPYMLSVAGGGLLFLFTVNHVHSADASDLLNNMSASLLSIPLVFLLYDYSNYRISRDLNQTLTAHYYTQTATLLLNITITLRQIAGIRGKLTFTALNRIQATRPGHITRNIKITPAEINMLQAYHSELDSMIFKYGKGNLVKPSDIQKLSGIATDIMHMINSYNFHKNKKVTAKMAVDIFSHIADWIDSDTEIASQFQKMLHPGGAKSELDLQTQLAVHAPNN